MPAGVNEKAWKRAEGIVKDAYPDAYAARESKDPKDREKRSKFYAMMQTIYKSVCQSPKYACEWLDLDEMTLSTSIAQVPVPLLGVVRGGLMVPLGDAAKKARLRHETLASYPYKSGMVLPTSG